MRHITILVVLAAALLVSAATANAGTYTVNICDPSVNGAANAIAATNSDPASMETAAQCPAAGVLGGLAAQNLTNGGKPAVGAQAGWTATAPDGNAITAVDVRRYGSRRDPSWKIAGTTSAGETFDTCTASVCAIGTPDPAAAPSHFDIAAAQSVTYAITCATSTCLTRPAAGVSGRQASLNVYSLALTIQDNTPPQITQISGAVNGNVKSGLASFAVSASDASGVARVVVLRSGKPLVDQQQPCDSSQMTPCPSSAAFTIDTSRFPTTAVNLDVQVTDAAGNTSSAPLGLTVDRSAPAKLTGLKITGKGLWRGPATMRIQAKAKTKGAPLAALRISTRARPKLAGSIRAVLGAPITLPFQGRKTIWVWGEDAVGNSNSKTARKLVVHYDSNGPAVTPAAYDELDPAVLTATVKDTRSGVKVAQWAYQNPDGTWTPLNTRLRHGHASAAFPYHTLPAGNYPLRLIATDNAANTTTATASAAGPLSANVYDHQGVAISISAIAMDGPIQATVRDAAGQPLPGFNVRVRVRDITQSEWKTALTLTSGPNGSISGTLPNQRHSSYVKIEAADPAHFEGASPAQLLTTAASSSLRLSSTKLSNGQTLRMSGQLTSLPVPRGGAKLYVEAFDRGAWVRAATLRTDKAGRWRWEYRFKRSRGVATYGFRVRIPKQSGLNYGAGVSGKRAVTVYGS